MEKVVILNDKKEEPIIEYPTKWGFKVIGKDKDKLLLSIKEVMGDKEHNCSFGNSSKTGKFYSYNASCIVKTKEERDEIFASFENHKDINMVI